MKASSILVSTAVLSIMLFFTSLSWGYVANFPDPGKEIGIAIPGNYTADDNGSLILDSSLDTIAKEIDDCNHCARKAEEEILDGTRLYYLHMKDFLVIVVPGKVHESLTFTKALIEGNKFYHYLHQLRSVETQDPWYPATLMVFRYSDPPEFDYGTLLRELKASFLLYATDDMIYPKNLFMILKKYTNGYPDVYRKLVAVSIDGVEGDGKVSDEKLLEYVQEKVKRETRRREQESFVLDSTRYP